ncbi:MAG TPA: aspartate/glutamate racemase family protein [Patescibacteria group bacterium]|nr:aspartate/glutamate racemase family protein [Patescibacteria group bacterium]
MKTLPKKKIGIVSGMGPLAGSDILSKILQYSAAEYGAVEDLEYPEVILISRGIDGFDNKGSVNDKFAEEVQKSIKDLNRAGADVIGISCNTAHIFYDYFNANSDVQVINLIEEVSSCLSSGGAYKYLLMTSASTRDSKLYKKSLLDNKINFDPVSDQAQDSLDKIIKKVMEHKLEQAGRMFSELLESFEIDGYAGIIAGCTELPLAAPYLDKSLKEKMIDSNMVLAMTLTDIAYGRKK